MSKEFDVKQERDPEVFEDNDEGRGEDSAYDQLAVEVIEYDHTQFELPDDYEWVDDDE